MQAIEKKAKSLSDEMLEMVIVSLAAMSDNEDARLAKEYMELEYFERHGEEKYEELLDKLAA